MSIMKLILYLSFLIVCVLSFFHLEFYGRKELLYALVILIFIDSVYNYLLKK